MKTERPMTDEERGLMQGHMTARQASGSRIWVALLFSLTLGPAIFAAIALIVFAALAAALGYSIRNGAWHQDPVTFYGMIAVGGAVWLGQVWSGVRWTLRARRSMARDLVAMAADLERGMVKDEVMTLDAVKLLREPEHGMIVIFLHLTDGRVFVLYDHGSVETDGDQAPRGPTLTPRQNLHLATFPKSKRRVSSFSGDPLPWPEVVELASAPDTWPEDEGWCRVKWQNIERHFGGKST